MTRLCPVCKKAEVAIGGKRCLDCHAAEMRAWRKDHAFINKWPRIRCTRCGRTLLQGERVHAALPFVNRPHTPLWCDGCYATETEAARERVEAR